MRVESDTDSQKKSHRRRPQISRRGMVEIVTVLGVYVLFLIVAVYSGQTTMKIDISPPEGTRFQSSPIELVARVTIKNVPIPDVEMTFTIHFDEKGEGSVKTLTDGSGVARLVLPLQSGNYTWHAKATKEGYPTIVSRPNSFSIRLALILYGLSPLLYTIAVSPVSFAARVTDTKGQLVTSANVTFYVDSTAIGSSLTATNGIAKLSSTVDPGRHTWFASANAGSEGGVSDPTPFIVAQASSLVTSDPVFFRTNHYQPTFDSRTPNSAYFSFTSSDCANTASESLRISCAWFLLSTPALSNAQSVTANRTPFQILSLCSGHTPHRSITRKL